MVINKSTTQLIGELIDVEQELSIVDSEERQEELQQEQTKLQTQVKQKVQNIDHFMVELNKREHLVDAEIEALKDEITRLKSRRKGLENTRDFFNKKLLPAVIQEVGSEEGVYETATARYKLYETFGPVDVDPHVISDEFKKVEILEKLDKVKARKAAISAFNAGEDMPPGIDIAKVKRVKRT
tara:strand:- start:117 stop:665 length:549 start_codon:yes stop_codon:yes gene_type:complete